MRAASSSRRPTAVRLLLALGLRGVVALDNGVGDVPAMGWNSWNSFRCDINEGLIREVARAMVSSGLRDAGYRYVNVDDCWQESRRPDGHIVPSHKKFPSGMRALGDYIHGLGLKFGIYSDAAKLTCENFPGSMGYEKLDAADYGESPTCPAPAVIRPVLESVLACRSVLGRGLPQVRLLPYAGREAAGALLLREDARRSQCHGAADPLQYLLLGCGRSSRVGQTGWKQLADGERRVRCLGRADGQK